MTGSTGPGLAVLSAVGRAAGPTGLPHFDAQWGAWVVLLLIGAGYAVSALRAPTPPARRQVAAFTGALVIALVALSWPLAPLAEHRLLLALVVQRLLLLLAVPPLLIVAIPPPAFAAATRPAIIDAVTRSLSRPIQAVVFVTVVGVGTLIVPAVQAQSSSPVARGGLDLALVVAGLVLWLPLQHPVPGTGRLNALGRAGYLVVQSIVPSFLCIVWIFARHPLYPAFAKAPGLFGLSALSDQQLSGFVAKLATIGVLWTVALFTVLHADQMTDADQDPDPLVWADVQRQLERADRRGRAGYPPRLDRPLAPPRVPGPVVHQAAPGTDPTGDGPPGPPADQGPPPGWALAPRSAGRGRRARREKRQGSPDGGRRTRRRVNRPVAPPGGPGRRSPDGRGRIPGPDAGR